MAGMTAMDSYISGRVIRPRLEVGSVSARDLLNFRIGDKVRLHNGREFFWAEIVEIKTQGYFTAVVSSRLKNTSIYNFGSLIRFSFRNIVGIIE